MEYELHKADPYKNPPVFKAVIKALGIPKVVIVRRGV
jgi:hypothetical protein